VKTVGTCIVDRWCVSWPAQGSKPQLSRCSQTSVATVDGVRAVMERIRHCIGELETSSGSLQVAVLSTGMRAWRGHEYIRAETMQEQHADLIDRAEEVLTEAEAALFLMDKMLSLNSVTSVDDIANPKDHDIPVIDLHPVITFDPTSVRQ
jgi:hypothetical protein